jgi:catalase
VFFLRDPAKFPHFIHTQKRHPATHLTHSDDSTAFWDYLSQNPESVHQVLILMGDRGIPDGWRHMHGYYGHTLKLVNKAGEWVYAQFHLISNQGIKTFTADEAAAKSPDYGQKDLYEAIERGDFPSWTMKVQTMTEKEAEQLWKEEKINVFDLTHVWPHSKFPLREVGKMTLNENSKNYFAEVEQLAFSECLRPAISPLLTSRPCPHGSRN